MPRLAFAGPADAEHPHPIGSLHRNVVVVNADSAVAVAAAVAAYVDAEVAAVAVAAAVE